MRLINLTALLLIFLFIKQNEKSILKILKQLNTDNKKKF